MGSCFSVHKDPAESAKKLRLVLGSKTDKVVIPSPVKDKPTGGDTILADLLLKPQPSPDDHPVTTSSDFGSKEESFFDTQPWLESDCDDDFYSVKGDFTPSCGNTPANQTFSLGTPKINGSILTDRTFVSQPELSPKKKSKKLYQLFRESLGGDQDINVQDGADNQRSLSIKMAMLTTGFDLPQKSAVGTPYSSACSGERTPGREFKADSKSTKRGQCCLPRLL